MYHLATIPTKCWVDLRKNYERLDNKLRDDLLNFTRIVKLDGGKEVEIYYVKEDRRNQAILAAVISFFAFGWEIGANRVAKELKERTGL